jgi:virginiamycin B lyase
VKKIVGTTLAALLLAGCGGGHASVVPQGSGQQTSAHQVQVAISILIPSPTPSSAKRRPAYISPSTKAAVVDVTGAGGPTIRTIVTCSGSKCVGSVPATVGLDTFAIGLNDKPDGSGNTLATGQATTTVVEGKANTLTVTFDGVVASLKVAFDKPNPPVSTTTTVTVLVSALDADGNTIVGPGSYDNPIVVTDGDTSGATKMTTATLNAPSDPAPTLTYNGAWIGGDSATAPITASVPANGAVKPATGQLAPAPQVVEYTLPTANSTPIDLVKGPDGAIWFTEQYGPRIGRVTTSGAFTEYKVLGSAQNPSYAQPWAIAVGADGNIWFTDLATFDEAIDSITPTGTITRHSVKIPYNNRSLYKMVSGPDNNLWLVDGSQNAIVRYTLAGVETDFAIPTGGSETQNLTAGPDNAIWFSEYGGSKIGRVDMAGTMSEYTAGASPTAVSWPLGITNGPDGALWYIDNFIGTINRMTTDGAHTTFPRGQPSALGRLITGPDGAVWYNTGGGTVGRISTKGTMSFFPLAPIQARGGEPYNFAIGGDGNIWYVDTYGNIVGKIIL